MDKNFDYYADLAQKALDEGNREDARFLMDHAKTLIAPPVAAPPAEAVDSESMDPVDWIDEPTVAEGYVPAEPVEEGKGFLGAAAEVPVNVSAAIGSMFQNVGETIDWATDSMLSWTGEPMSLDVDNASPEQLRMWEDAGGIKLFDAFGTQVKYISGADREEFKQANFYNMLKLGEVAEDVLYTGKDAKADGMQETLAGSLTHGVTQFLAGYMLLAPLKVAKDASTVTKFVAASGKGAVVDFAAFDAHEARAADMMIELGMEGEYLQWLKADKNDTILEGKMKNAIEGLGLGVVAEGLFLFLRASKNWTQAKLNRSEGNIKKAEELEKEAIAIQEEARAKAFKDAKDVDIVDPEGNPVATVTDADAAIFKDEGDVPTVDADVPAPKKGEKVFRAQEKDYGDKDGQGVIYYSHDESYVSNYKSDTRDIVETTVPDDALDFRTESARAKVTPWIEAQIAKFDDLDLDGMIDGINGDLKLAKQAMADGDLEKALANINQMMNKQDGSGIVSGVAQKRMMDELGIPAIIAKENDNLYTIAFREDPQVAPKKVELDESAAPLGTKLPDPDDPLQGAKDNQKLRNEKGDFRDLEGGHTKHVSWRESNVKGAQMIARLMKGNDDGTGIIQLAKQLGEVLIDPKQADEYVAATLQLETFIWKQYEALARTPAAKAGDAETLRKLEVLAEAMRYSQANRTGGQSANGRALALSKQIKEIIPDLDFELTPEGMVRKLNQEANAGTIKKTALKLNKVINAVNELWLNSLLSGASTQAINIVSNTMVTWIDVLEVAGGAGISAIKNPKEGARQLKLAQRQAVGIVKYARISAQLAGQTLRHGRNILDEESMVSEAVNNVVGDVAIGSGNKDILKVFSDPSMSAIDRAGNIIRIPSRGLMGGDELFKQVNFRAKAYAYAAEEIDKQIGASSKLTEADFDKMVEARIDEAYKVARESKKGDIIADPIANKALKAARVNTFTNDLGEYGKAFQGFVGDVPLLRQVVPFIRTPINILKYAAKRSPLGLASKNMRDTIGRGGEEGAQAIFQIAYGTVLWGGAYSFVSDWYVTVDAGGGDKMQVQGVQGSWAGYTYQQKQAMRASGASPNSYYNKEKGTWEAYNRFDPMAMFIGVAADVRDVMESGKTDGLADASSAAIIAIANQFKDKSYVKGLSDFIKAADDPERYWENYFNQKVGSFVPSAVAQLKGDEHIREVRSVMDAVLNRLPVFSETLEPTYDILGQPNIRPEGFLQKGTKWHDDTVRSEMFRLAPSIGKPSERHPSGVDLPDFKNDKGQTAYARYNELIGESKVGNVDLKTSLERMILSDHYQKNLKDGGQDAMGKIGSSREKALKKIVNKHREVAMRKLRKEFPELDTAIKTREKEIKNAQHSFTGGANVFQRGAKFDDGQPKVDVDDLLNGLF